MNNINEYNPIIEKIYKETAKTIYEYLYFLTNNQEIAEELTIAKNYLTEEELKILNRMVSAYLDIAEKIK